jgi:hypothetical protein
MKKVRLLALAVLLVALAANGMVTHSGRTHLLCDDVPGPNTLCSGSTDTGCNSFCLSDPSCDGFTGVHGSCNASGDCNCRGTPQP